MRTHANSFLLAAAALLATVHDATAQQASNGMPLELRPFVELRPVLGAYATAGERQANLHDAAVIGFQVAVEATRRLHLVGSFSFVPTEAGEPDGPHDRVRIYLFDAGAEWNMPLRPRGYWTPKPFISGGFAWRTYRDVSRDVGRSYPGGYGGLGLELQTDVIGLRAEVRDYVSRFAGFAGDERSGTRNDLVATLGIAYHIR